MRIRIAVLLAVSVLSGCDEVRVHLPTPATVVEPVVIGSRFDPATAGQLTGSVSWVGERPNVPRMKVCRLMFDGPRHRVVSNPNAPDITPTGELAGAVVFLRGVDPATAAPWSHAPVVVVADDERITTRPGGRVGFVRVGDEVEFRCESDELLGVRVRDAAYFTLMLPDRAAVRRRLDRPGHVGLTSPANIYWAVADLFVCEHPYYGRTDDRGRFRFDRVPPGDYELVCWVPSWEIAATERDPETGAIFRATYARPAEVVSRVRVTPAGTSDVRIDVSPSVFPPR